MAFNELFYHFVFVTKSRQHTIPPLYDGVLHAYMGGVMKNLKCQPLKINGTDNHVHILIKAPTDLSPIDFARDVKRASSIWMKSHQEKFPHFNSWSREYAVFSVSKDNVESVSRYISNQKEHHRLKSFEDEYYDFLTDETKKVFVWKYFDT